MDEPEQPLVYLVGAGPGNPGLLTLRAVECLSKADVVLHDKLVSPRVLEYAPAEAQRISVESMPGEHPQRWPHIHQAMIELARQGKVVVRLKGGDPFVFGRGAEETEALRQAGIAYECVPGVTAALGAASFAEIPLTHRACASAVALITGHENPTKPESSLDWAALARFPGTLVIYMGMARLELIVQVLLQQGKPADTPAAIVQSISTGYQQTRVTTLANLDRTMREEGLMPPALVMIGPVVSLKPTLSWFEQRSLFGCRVLVTRPRHQAQAMIRRLEALGAIPYLLPAVEIQPPSDWAPVDAALTRLTDFSWVVFTSVNGVQAFFNRLLELRLDLRAIGHLRFAAIGPATAAELRSYHILADVVPGSFRSEDLATALLPVVAGQRVLLPRADRGREHLREELARVATVEQIAVYSQRDSVDPNSEVLLALQRGEIGVVALTSANIARALLNQLDEIGRQRVLAGTVRLVSISPVTSAAIRDCGFEPAAEATHFTIDGIIAATVRLVTAQRSLDAEA